MRKGGMVIFILLFLILFVFLGLGSSQFWWRGGTGHSAGQQFFEQFDRPWNIDVNEAVFEDRGIDEQTLALVRALELYRKAQLDEMLHPIEGNVLTNPVYGAAKMTPRIVTAYWSAIPMAFEAMSAGVTNKEAFRKEDNGAIRAKHYGLIYATLMVNGVHIPLFALILVTTRIIVGFGSKKTRRFLIIAIPLLCLYGMIFLAIAQCMVSLVPTSFWVLL